MKDLIEKIFDPDATPSLTSVMNIIAFTSGLIGGMVFASLGNELAVSFCQLVFLAGIAGKVVQYGETVFSK